MYTDRDVRKEGMKERRHKQAGRERQTETDRQTECVDIGCARPGLEWTGVELSVSGGN
jgi:hypothetical protein